MCITEIVSNNRSFKNLQEIYNYLNLEFSIDNTCAVNQVLNNVLYILVSKRGIFKSKVYVLTGLQKELNYEMLSSFKMFPRKEGDNIIKEQFYKTTSERATA